MPPTLPQSLRSLPHTLDLRSLLSSTPNHAPPKTPTRSLNSLSLASFFRRQVTTVTATAAPSANPIVPAYYSGLNADPTPGTVVGIVFGSVAAFLLVLWFIYTCLNFSNQFGRSSVIDEREVRVHSRSRSPRRRSVSSRNESEVIEVERTHRSRSRTRSPPRSPPRRQSRRRETVIIEETRRPQPAPRSEPDEVVEVFEEHSPPRRESKKESRRVSGGFRTVDPEAFGGGDRPMRKVSRR